MAAHGSGTFDEFEQDRPNANLAFSEVACVFVGGAIGVLGRYLVIPHLGSAMTTIPWALLLLNTVGALCLGFALPVFDRVGRHLVRLTLTTGLLGGWTTYSSVALAAGYLTRNGCGGRATVFVVLSLLSGLCAAGLGEWMAKRVLA